MLRLKDAVLREFGDRGAETLERYFIQLQYTAVSCIEMLLPDRSIIAVLPEGVEDIALDRGATIELRQVKTRDESQGPWTMADVLPIFCKLYHHRKAFKDRACTFHFTSDRMAEPRLRGGRKGMPPLYALKFLLQVELDGYARSADENAQLSKIEAVVLPLIQKGMQEHGESLSLDEVRQLLHSTTIDTDSALLRNPDCVGQMALALELAVPAEPSRTQNELRAIVDRLLLKILRTIISTSRVQDRRLCAQDVLSCRAGVDGGAINAINLGALPGRTILEKKALLGGFDPTEVPVFQKQKLLADATIRELLPLGYERETERFAMRIVDHQHALRDAVCRRTRTDGKSGPDILRSFRDSSASLLDRHALPAEYVDLQFCLGLLWRETDLCSVWWNSFTPPENTG